MVALIDPSFKFQQRIMDTLVWSKLNYTYIAFNFIIPIFILCVIACALKDNYNNKMLGGRDVPHSPLAEDSSTTTKIL